MLFLFRICLSLFHISFLFHELMYVKLWIISNLIWEFWISDIIINILKCGRWWVFNVYLEGFINCGIGPCSVTQLLQDGPCIENLIFGPQSCWFGLIKSKSIFFPRICRRAHIIALREERGQNSLQRTHTTHNSIFSGMYTQPLSVLEEGREICYLQVVDLPAWLAKKRYFQQIHLLCNNHLDLFLCSGCCKIVELLLAKGAYTDPVTCCGTPLHIAATEGQDGTMKILLNHNADVSLTVFWLYLTTPMFKCSWFFLVSFLQ